MRLPIAFVATGRALQKWPDAAELDAAAVDREQRRFRSGHDVWVVRLRGREDRLDVVDPKLDETKVADVSQQLGEILNETL